jgi:hypothetical protein
MIPGGIQDDIIDPVVHKYGCYAICLIKLAELDIIKRSQKDPRWTGDSIVDMIQRGKLWISSKDCTVLDAGGFLSYLTGAGWTKEWGPRDAEGPTTIREWYNPRTNYNHFNLCDWDPLRASVTVKEGYIRSTRIMVKHA